MKRLAIYCRISNLKSGLDDYSIQTQLEAGMQFAGNNWETETYIDEGITGTSTNRKSFNDLLKDAKKKKIDAIYCFDQSRLERDLDIWKLIENTCISYSIELYISGKLFDFNDPTNKMNGRMVSTFNSYYAEITSLKVRQANKLKVKQNKTHGQKPYGFTRDENNFYKIIDEEAQIVREIFDLALQGIGAYTIANKLNERKIKPRSAKLWHSSVVGGILENPIYIGKRIYKTTISKSNNNIDEIIENEIEHKIISNQIFEKVQKIRSKNKYAGRKNKYKYLLNGILFCPSCGSEVTGIYRMSAGANNYKCKNFHKHYNELSCKEAFPIHIPKADTFIINLLFKTFLIDFTVVESLQKNNDLSKLEDELILKQTELKTTSKKLNKLLNVFENDISDDDNILSDRIKKYSRQIKELKEDIAEKIVLIEKRKSNFELNKTKKILNDYFENIDIDNLQLLISELVDKILVARSEDKEKILFEIKLKNFDEKLMYVTDKNLKTFELCEFKSETKRELFKNNFVNYFSRFTIEEKEKFRQKYFASNLNLNRILFDGNHKAEITISNSEDEAEFIKNNSIDYIDDESLFNEVANDILLKTLYENLSINLDTKNLIRFYPIPKRKINKTA